MGKCEPFQRMRSHAAQGHCFGEIEHGGVIMRQLRVTLRFDLPLDAAAEAMADWSSIRLGLRFPS